jgi:hypothetical protein
VAPVSTHGAPKTQARLELDRTTIGRLMEWQAREVSRGNVKPTYSEILDALVASVPVGDPLVLDLLTGERP